MRQAHSHSCHPEAPARARLRAIPAFTYTYSLPPPFLSLSLSLSFSLSHTHTHVGSRLSPSITSSHAHRQRPYTTNACMHVSGFVVFLSWCLSLYIYILLLRKVGTQGKGRQRQTSGHIRMRPLLLQLLLPAAPPYLVLAPLVLVMRDLWMWGMTPPPAMVALMSASSSSSPRMASCK